MAARIIAYTRVSTQSQVPNSSLATQRFVIEQYAQVNDLVIDEVVREVGSAYRSIPAKMQELSRTLPNGSRILVALTDRFSRNIVNGRLLLDLFQEKGIAVSETVRDQHSNTLPGRAHFNRQIQSAQDESENKSLRCNMFTAFKATEEYEEFQEGGSDYEPSDVEDVEGGESDEDMDEEEDVEDEDYIPMAGN